MGVDVRGKIALMRFGKLFRGDKVYNAEKFGAIGAILFSDPEDVAREGIDKVLLYEEKLYSMYANIGITRKHYLSSCSFKNLSILYISLNLNFGVQRGSLLHPLTAGDPLTPLYPSKKELFKSLSQKYCLKFNKWEYSKISRHYPINSCSSYFVLNRIRHIEENAPNDWQGIKILIFLIIKRFYSNILSDKYNYKILKIKITVGHITYHSLILDPLLLSSVKSIKCSNLILWKIQLQCRLLMRQGGDQVSVKKIIFLLKNSLS
uniref:PA domain-containing protein n=1 Tax=Heterorhabditis bacteriophora TaxID=37862 RepID=A0A1I7WF66_HETBA